MAPPIYMSLCSVLRKVAAGTYIGGLDMSDISIRIILINYLLALRGSHYYNDRFNWGNELGKYDYVLPSFE